MSFLSKLLEPVRVYPITYLKGLIVRIFIVGIELGIIVIMQQVAHGVETKNVALLTDYLYYFPIGLIIYYIAKRHTRDRMRPNPENQVIGYLWQKYFKKILTMESNHLETIGTGKLIEIIKPGFDTWVITLDTLKSRIPEIVMKPLFAGWVLYTINPRFSAAFLLGIIILTIISIILNNQAMKTRYPRKEHKLNMSKRFIRFVSSRIEILQSGQGNREIGNQLDDNRKISEINEELNKYLFLMFNIPIFSIQCLTIAGIRYAIQGLTHGDFSFAIFTGLTAITGFMATLMIDITAKYKNLTKDIANVEKLREYLDDAPMMENYNTGESFIYKKGAIELKNISFTYNEGSKVFDNFSLKIQGGKKTAFVGNSGSGKSTLVKLISGLLSPDSGQVLIDGQLIGGSPVRGAGEAGGVVSLKSFYQHIGFLQQEPIIFDGTVKENILYGLTTEQTNNHIQDTNQNQKSKLSPPDKGDTAKPRGFDNAKRLSEILHQSQCHFVYDLPNGLDTEVGERGVRLSGGQKQRLAIARIFAKNPDIIILDEPTSALDSFAEEEITKAMHELCKGKTVLIIAHRLQTVKEADEIIVLGVPHPLLGDQRPQFLSKEGLGGGKKSDTTILERGTHTELTKNNGPYTKMLKLQTGF